jgi:lipid A 3-O-deacylase
MWNGLALGPWTGGTVKQRIIAGVCAAISLSIHAAHGGELTDLSVLVENDLWVGKTDHWYTNGVRVSWASDGDPEYGVAEFITKVGKTFLWGYQKPRMNYAIGQTMYTPTDITVSTAQPNDRPWGGYLYFAAAASEFHERDFRRNEMKVGVTGPYAYTEQTQTFVHRNLTKSPIPEGWHQQLKQRLGVQWTTGHIHRFGDDAKDVDLFGFQWGYGLSVGTVRVNANANVGMVFGDLKGTNSPMFMGNEGDFVTPDFENRKQFEGVVAFVMAGITGVAYNYFIEGPTPYGKSDLTVRPFYGSAQAGLSIPLWEFEDSRLRLVVAVNAKQAEFNRRLDGTRGDATKFGGIELNLDSKH